jgi:uncharacterized protein (TIGR03067 family)
MFMGRIGEGFGLGCGFAIGRAVAGLIGAVVVVGVLVFLSKWSPQDGGPGAKPDDTRKDEESLQGVWQLVALEQDGKPATTAELKEIKDRRLTVKGDQMSHGIPGVTFKGSFKLDAGKKPKAIDLTDASGSDKARTSLGIYSLEDDTLKMCLDVIGRDRPTEFKGGKGIVIMTFKRGKP